MGCPFWISTGYGRTAREYVPRLQKLGHEVAVYCYAGLHHGAGLKVEGIWHYPNYAMDVGTTFARNWYNHFRADVMITHMDCWVLGDLIPKMANEGYRIVSWTPTDHDPLPPPIKYSLQGAIANVAMTHFAKKTMQDAALSNVSYIPHAYDPNIFYPMDKQECRKYWDIPADKFVLLTVIANTGVRKNVANFLRAVRIFIDRRPNARNDICVIVHAYPHHDNVNPTGYALDTIWGPEVLDIGDIVKQCDPFEYLRGFTDEEMSMLYSASDWLISNSLAEGFGLPCVESLACKTPVMYTDFAAGPEVVGPGGWPIEVIDRIPFELSSSWQSFPSTDDLADKIERAYDDWLLSGSEKRDELGEEGFQHVQKNFQWDNVMLKWTELLDLVTKDIRPSHSKHIEGLQLGVNP